MSLRLLCLAPLAFAVLAGCAKATPDLQLREETSSAAGSLCERMAEDFDMVVAGGSDVRGRLYRVSLASRMISARGVSWGFRLVDDNPAETCVNTTNGVTCDITGPAEFRVQSIAGRAVYQVADGERAVVASEAAIMTCQEQP